MILFFDTETTGIANFRMPPAHPSQPRIVQLGAQLCAEDRRVVAEINLLVKPEGWTIPAEATAVHGITTAMCDRYGLPIRTVILLFARLVARADLLVAHNFEFDRLLVHRELEPEQAGAEVERFLAKCSFCTMRTATDVCRIPSARGGYKWPSLQEAHRHFFAAEFDGAHDAMADVRACARIFYALRDGNHAPQAAAQS